MPHRRSLRLAAALAPSLFIGAPLALHAESTRCIGERKPVLKTLNAKQLRSVGMAEDTAAIQKKKTR
ncbi:MAG: hypothetical protein HY927_07185 [Elusimicrobia bacterium]|nr:hypothetical protein [Elusimicrobiota bacterium]